jgi:hypothetical protein
MKEQSLIEMKNKIDALIRVVEYLTKEHQHITTLASGMMQTIKLMQGYDDAIKILTEKAQEEILAKKVEEDLKVT